METLRKHILYSDMDGTLLTDEKKVSRKTRKALEHFTELGGRFSVATGRSKAIAEPFFPELPLALPAIFFNGAAVFDYAAGKYRKESFLPDALLHELYSLGTTIYPEVCTEAYCEVKVLCNPNGIMDQAVLREKQPHRFAGIGECTHAMKFLYHGDPAKLREISAALHESFSQRDFVQVFSSPFYLEILAPDSSKGDALAGIARQLSIPREEIAAIGDFDNDVSMLKFASLSAAPANGAPAALEAARIVTADNNHDAVADFIENHLIVNG